MRSLGHVVWFCEGGIHGGCASGSGLGAFESLLLLFFLLTVFRDDMIFSRGSWFDSTARHGIDQHHEHYSRMA